MQTYVDFLILDYCDSISSDDGLIHGKLGCGCHNSELAGSECKGQLLHAESRRVGPPPRLEVET